MHGPYVPCLLRAASVQRATSCCFRPNAVLHYASYYSCISGCMNSFAWMPTSVSTLSSLGFVRQFAFLSNYAMNTLLSPRPKSWTPKFAYCRVSAPQITPNEPRPGLATVVLGKGECQHGDGIGHSCSNRHEISSLLRGLRDTSFASPFRRLTAAPSLLGPPCAVAPEASVQP